MAVVNLLQLPDYSTCRTSFDIFKLGLKMIELKRERAELILCIPSATCSWTNIYQGRYQHTLARWRKNSCCTPSSWKIIVSFPMPPHHPPPPLLLRQAVLLEFNLWKKNKQTKKLGVSEITLKQTPNTRSNWGHKATYASVSKVTWQSQLSSGSKSYNSEWAARAIEATNIFMQVS